MKFKKSIILSFFVAFIVIFSSCSSNVETEIEKLFIEEHSNHLGKAEIISIKQEKDHYIVEWKNEKDFSRGIDKVTKDKEIEMIESEIN